MSLGEFDLIARYFVRPAGIGPRRAAVGNGDDCALIAPAPGLQLAVSTDTLVEGRHFLSTVPPRRLGHKALAVNLSDLAACGARPLGFTLALTLPRADPHWLAPFSQGLLALADAHDCELVGGDTTAGPLSIGITVFGEVSRAEALLRSGARAGDDLWVSGHPGQARLALEAFRDTLEPPVSSQHLTVARQAMECPQPRVALGLALRGLASAAIDVSDGLLGDLGHVLRASQVGVSLLLDALPLGPTLQDRPRHHQLAWVLQGGDDYELLFTAPAIRREEVNALSASLGLTLTRIGRMEAATGVRFWQGATDFDRPGLHPVQPTGLGESFDHFKGAA